VVPTGVPDKTLTICERPEGIEKPVCHRQHAHRVRLARAGRSLRRRRRRARPAAAAHRPVVLPHRRRGLDDRPAAQHVHSRTATWAQAIRPPEAPDPPGRGGIGDVLAVLDAALDRGPALDRGRVGVLGGYSPAG
jgi:hypothetical protein